MYVPSYQIHHVLNVYSKKLGQNRLLDRQRASNRKPPVDSISISTEGKRRAVIEKVAANIVERITRCGPRDEVDHEVVNQLQNEIKKKA